MKRLTDGLLRLNPAADDNPKLADFHQSLIYIVNHDENGAIGVNLNKFFQSTVSDLLENRSDIPATQLDHLLIPNTLCGGPVYENMVWILRRRTKDYQKAFSNETLSLCFSNDGFSDLNSPALIGVGCVSWNAGKLENELAQGLWLHYPADQELLTNIPFSDPPLFAVHLFIKLRFEHQKVGEVNSQIDSK